MTAISRARQRLQEQGTETAARFAGSFARARRDLDRLSRQGEVTLVAVLRDLGAEIRSALLLAGDPNAPITALLAPGLVGEIDRAISGLAPRLEQGMANPLQDAFQLGSGTTAAALNAVNVPVAFPSVTPGILTSLTASVGDVLTELVSDIGVRIQGVIQRAAVSLTDLSAATNQISQILKTSTEVRLGLRRRIGFAFQAESIARTEIRRIYSNAQQAASEQLALTLPDLRKRWVTVLGERRGHREAEARYAPGGSVGPIPIKDTFRVQDFTRTGRSQFLTLGGRVQPAAAQRVVRTSPFTRRGRVITDRMLFPRDPSASAGSVVNCTCIVMEVLPELETAQLEAQGIIGAV